MRNVTIRGLAVFSASMRSRSQKMREAARTVVNDTATDVFNDSQRAVPVDLGNLKASGRLEKAKRDELVAFVSYGGTAAEYALIVHETHPTKSKYLEEPARKHLATFKVNLRKATKAATR